MSNSLQLGSFGLFNNSIMVDVGRPNLASSLVYNRTQRDGFRQNDQYHRDALTWVTQLRPGPATNATMLVYFADMTGHIASSIDSLTFNTNPGAAAQNWLRTQGYNQTRTLLAGVSANHSLARGFAADVSLFSTIHNEKERRPFDFLYEDRQNAGTRIKGSWSGQQGRAFLQLLAGTELFIENFRYSTFQNIDGIGQQGEIISRNREVIWYTNNFIQADMDMGYVNFSAGLNANFNQINYSDLMHIGGIDRSALYDYGLIISPRISANYRFHDLHAVFGTISHGFSPPSLSETLTPEGFVNPEILPERSWNFESGIRGSFLENMLFYDLSFYRMNVSDLLVAQRVGEDAWVGRNAGSSQHQGIEFEVQGIILENTNQGGSFWQSRKISLRAALSYNHFMFTDYIDNEIDHSGNKIPGVPSFYLNSDLLHQMAGGLSAGLGVRFVGSMPMNDANSRFTDPYVTIGAMAGYRNNFGQWDLELYTRIDNLFDQHYASMILVNAPSFGNAAPRYYYPGMPVHFSVGLIIRHMFPGP